MIGNNWNDFFKKEQDIIKNALEKYNKLNRITTVFPSRIDLFRAYELTNPNTINVVMVGQDPYSSFCKTNHHKTADGLAFSSKCINLPMTLRNIFKKLNYHRINGDLSDWANQGVMLLNTQLSSVCGDTKTKFWKTFVDDTITYLDKKNPSIIFVLLGADALEKKALIKHSKNIIITSHPSPRSYKRPLKEYPAFNDINIFKIINARLKLLGKANIRW